MIESRGINRKDLTIQLKSNEEILFLAFFKIYW